MELTPIETSDDAALVRVARDARAPRDIARACGELVRRHERGVQAVALSLLHDTTEAEDMAQEAFLRAFRNLDLLADPARFGVWVRRIVFGVCVDWLRVFRPGLHLALDDDIAGRTADGSPSVHEQLERAELSARVLAVLDRLPARYRVPLTMYHLDGLSHARVARALDLPEGTVRSLVTRARRRLASLLAPSATAMTDTPAAPRDPLDVLDADAPLAPRLMHVLNGDSVRVTLERSDVPGAFAVWADALHEGPILADTDDPTWREVRTRFWNDDPDTSVDEGARMYDGWQARLATFREYDEVVLWFEHDLFDQLLLVRHLDWFAKRELGRTRLSLICIGAFPGVEPFHGLGQLDADQLASLLGTRQALTRRHLLAGRAVWRAFAAADPAGLETIAHRLLAGEAVASDGAAVSPEDFPFLAGALRRFLDDYPSVDNGLPLTEQRILQALSGGPLSPAALFRAAQALEERVYMGDTTFWRRLAQLAAPGAALVVLDGVSFEEPGPPGGSVVLTDLGRDVLAGRADWIRLGGFDRWLGGAHLTAARGGEVAWRRERDGRLVACQSNTRSK